MGYKKDKYGENLIDRLGGIWWIIGLWVISLVVAIIMNIAK